MFDDSDARERGALSVCSRLQGPRHGERFTGYAQLFPALLGHATLSVRGTPTCWSTRRSPTSPPNDLSDWTWVTVRGLMSGESRLQPYTCRRCARRDLALQLPRVGSTRRRRISRSGHHDSNQHRVDREPDAAGGAGWVGQPNSITRAQRRGLDPKPRRDRHRVLRAHKAAHPLRSSGPRRFASNDRNDFPPSRAVRLARTRARRDRRLAFATSIQRRQLAALGPLLMQITVPPTARRRSRALHAITQKLCSSELVGRIETDPEFRARRPATSRPAGSTS